MDLVPAPQFVALDTYRAMRAGELKISHNVYFLTAGPRFRHYQNERRHRRMWANYRPLCTWRVKWAVKKAVKRQGTQV